MIDTEGFSARALAAAGIAVEAGKVALTAFRERRADAALSFKGPQDYITEVWLTLDPRSVSLVPNAA
jgi:hypothetical protein